MPGALPHHISTQVQDPYRKHPPQPQSCNSSPKITCHPHHLIGRPSVQRTWVLRVPTLFSSNLFLSYCMLMLLNCSTVSAHIPGLDPNLEADCMHPCAFFASPSPSPPCR